MTVPFNEPTAYDFASTGASSYVTLPLRITSANDLDVYANSVKLASGTYSVSAVTTSTPYTFTLSLTTPVPSGQTIFLLQNFEQSQETNLVDGQALTAATFNSALDKITLMVKDQAYIQDNTNLRYDLGKISSVTDAMKAIPIPDADETALTWTTAGGFSWQPNHPGGQTVDEFKAALAAPGGSALVGFSPAGTVQSIVASNVTNIATNTAFRVLLGTAATSVTASGAYNITYWNKTTSTDLQTMLDAFTATATGVSDSGATYFSFWNTRLGTSRTLQAEIASRPEWISGATISATQTASAADSANFYFTTSTT